MLLNHPWCTDASLIQGKKRALSIYISINGVNVGKHKRNISTEPQYLPQSYCVWWGWVGRPCAAGSPGSSPAGCRRTPQSRRRRAESPTPEQDRKVIGDWLEKLSGSPVTFASIVLFKLGILLGKTNRHFSLVSAFIMWKTLKTYQSLCEVSPSWKCRGQTFECVRGHGSRGEGSRTGPATTDRYRGPTPALCSGNTGSSLGWLCTTYGSSPATKRKWKSPKFISRQYAWELEIEVKLRDYIHHLRDRTGEDQSPQKSDSVQVLRFIHQCSGEWNHSKSTENLSVPNPEKVWVGRGLFW